MLVYKSPGPHRHKSGKTYDIRGATADELPVLLAKGWHEDRDIALGLKAIDPQPEPESAEDTSPPTRDEMEAKATEIGLKVDGRWSDARLLSEIEKALAK